MFGGLFKSKTPRYEGGTIIPVDAPIEEQHLKAEPPPPVRPIAKHLEILIEKTTTPINKEKSLYDKAVNLSKEILKNAQTKKEELGEEGVKNLMVKTATLEKLGFTASKTYSDKKDGARENSDLLRESAGVVHYSNQYHNIPFIPMDSFRKFVKDSGLTICSAREYTGELSDSLLQILGNVTPLKSEDYANEEFIVEFRFDEDSCDKMRTFLRTVDVYVDSTDGRGEPHRHHIEDAVRKLGYTEDVVLYDIKCYAKRVNKYGLFVAAFGSQISTQKAREGDIVFKDFPIIFRYCKDGIQIIS